MKKIVFLLALMCGIASAQTLVLPQNGGTGVANNSAATLTRSGSHALTITTTGTTGVTLPTSGTLATVAGTLPISGGNLTGNLTLNNATFLRFNDSGGTARNVLTVDGSNDIYIGPSAGTGGMYLYAGSALRLAISSSGVVTIGNLAGVGTRAVVVDANGVLSAP